MLQSTARTLLRFCARGRSERAQFVVDSLVSPTVYKFVDMAVLPQRGRGGASGLATLEKIVLPVLQPGSRDAVDLHEVETNIRFRSWVRNAYLEQRFGNSPALRQATQRFFHQLPAVPTLREMDEIFGTGSWDRHPEESEDALQRKLVKAYETDPQSCAHWDLETILEAIGCCVAGMNEFNVYCERHFVYEFLTKDYINALWRHLQKRCDKVHAETGKTEITILELGAGTGQLTWLLERAFNKSRMSKSAQKARSYTCKFVATDTGTWSTRHQRGAVQELQNVERASYTSALASFSPDIVLCSWMPLGEDWTQAMRETSSVQEYILIGETDDGCCGHPWKTWGVHVHRSNDPMFAKNRANLANANPDRSVDLFHWLGRDRRPQIASAAAVSNADADADSDDDILDPEPGTLQPPYEADGFQRQNLSLSDLQLSRYDRAHYAANSHTVSFTRQAHDLAKEA
ncbi:Hypothetical Protein FCC1311_096712 [Hondaea fermentalgiana]|uniref:Uncharacterized protein n=1 Tax=Hondaea fermentalgiana TaxID=2315210 RepID=A0A2R5GUL5_9STRA|nr:Hypothetical Protein FCC1311_096712 [Hondaea fermentalgiana]|eukprot:GBG33448.1 Hypothetical Protein FCC1311_096712 [Hondaea fermentalgiana]